MKTFELFLVILLLIVKPYLPRGGGGGISKTMRMLYAIFFHFWYKSILQLSTKFHGHVTMVKLLVIP